MILRTCLMCTVIIALLLEFVSTYGNPSCAAVQRQWSSHFGGRYSPNRRSDENFCGNSNICCHRDMLVGMAETSEQDARRLLKNILETNAENFRNDTLVLKTYVIDNLGRTMEQLHTQLRADFKYKFQRHEQFFLKFFTTIQGYLFGTLDGLPALVSSFFDELTLRVTQILLNSNSNDAHTKCVVEGLRSKHPLHGIPSIITSMTMEAFPLVRSAINSMAFARETLLAASITIDPSSQCIGQYQQLRFCSLCAGLLTASPCESDCQNLGEVCAPQHRLLGPLWRTFIMSLQQVLEQVNKFPKVHRPLQMHLTDAIMNLKSTFTQYEHELLSNCSAYATLAPPLPMQSMDEAGLRRTQRQALPPYYRQSPPSPPQPGAHGAFETKPLPSVYLGEQSTVALQNWAHEVKLRYNIVATLFDNMGSEMCNSEAVKPTFGVGHATSSTCWNGTSLVPSSAVTAGPRSEASTQRGGGELPSDPTLRQKAQQLQRVAGGLQEALRQPPADPAVVPLADPAATALRVGRADTPVDSDEEALHSYLAPAAPALPAGSFDAHNGGAAAPPAWGVRPPPLPLPASQSDLGFGRDTEPEDAGAGSGFAEGEDAAPLPYGGPFAPPLHSLGADADPLAPQRAPPLPPQPQPHPVFPSTGADDEDFRASEDNFGSKDMYEAAPSVETSGQQQQVPPFPSPPYVPPTHWDTEYEYQEEVGSGVGPWAYSKPVDPQLPPPIQPEAPSANINTGGGAGGGDSVGLVVGEGKLEIPDQIWVPEGDGVVQHYPGTRGPSTDTTSSASLSSYSILLPLLLSLVSTAVATFCRL